MYLVIHYQYSEQLKQQLYVESAARERGGLVNVLDTQLSAPARAHALRALVDPDICLLLLSAPKDPNKTFKVTCASACTSVSYYVPEPLDAVPTAADVLAIAEAALATAAEAAPAIKLAHDKRLAHEAAEREREIQSAVSQGPARLVCGDPGKRQLACYGPTIGGESYIQAWPHNYELMTLIDEARALASKENAEHEQEQEQQLQALRNAGSEFLREHARGKHFDRWQEGLMDDDEMLGILRDHLFAALAEQPRYIRLAASHVCHDDDCAVARDGGPRIEFASEPVKSLTADRYARLRRVRELAHSIGASCAPRVHYAICSECGGSSMRYSALVTLSWSTRTLSREYSLDG